MDKRFLIILVVLVVGFFGFLAFRPKEDSPSANAELTNHIRGEGTITLTEYGDFQCPACFSYKPTIDQVLAKYDGKVRFQFRHLPLSSIHANAVSAARAAEAASLQGKFWEMYDKLYDQTGWLTWSQSSNNAAPTFRTYAQQIGLNMEQYDQDVNSAEVLASINADRAEAERLGFTGTPSFQLNGETITVSENSVDAFSKIIDEALAKQTDSQQ